VTDATVILSHADAAGFALIGLLAVMSWIKRKGRNRACLASALGLLGLVSVIGQLTPVVHPPTFVAVINLACFMASGYALVELRHNLIPLPGRVRPALIVILAATTLLAVPLTLTPPNPSPGPYAWIVGCILILEWTACITEPAIRFWLAARSRPVIQRNRLRALSGGYLGIAIALVLALGAAVGAAAASTRPSPAVGLAFQVVATAAIPLFYIGFAPPAWLRRAWRGKEADAYRGASDALMTFAESQPMMAARAVEWATRFVGASAGLMLSIDGNILASQGLSADEADMLARHATGASGTTARLLDGEVAVVPVRTAVGVARLVVSAGPLAPLFGSDEIRTLAGFATSVATAMDRVRLSEQLRDQTQRMESLLEAVSELGAGLLISEQGRLVYANDAYVAMTGYTSDELQGCNLIDLAPDSEQHQLQALLEPRPVGNEGRHRYESRLLRKDGETIDVEAVVHSLENEGAIRFISLVQDITARKRAELALAEAAMLDPLTAIPNRRAWKDQLTRTIAHAGRHSEPLSVAVLDLDNFKEFNDDWGHQRGDRLLVEVAHAWRAALRQGDFLARFGGDEFSVIMPGCTATQAVSAIQRLIEATPEMASAGLAQWDGSESAEEFVERADAALLRSKKETRGGVTVARGHLENRFTSWTSRLDTMLERRYLTSAFQPIIRFESSEVLGYEALLRMSGAAADSSVEDLFTAAQRLGYSRDLDWLSRRVALENSWHLPQDALLFINVSARALLDPVHETDQMLMLLRWVDRSATNCVLEISEREMINDLNRLRDVLADYRAHGFRFALDDVGEGHSTLEVLASANAEYIKVARSLSERVEQAGPGSAVRAIVTFAESSGAAIVAEGISDLSMVGVMRELGIDYGQGFALGRPKFGDRSALDGATQQTG
jgi:diguanylate cyclase (GGDEF)-like protein/PAS domain S-box-containing protein